MAAKRKIEQLSIAPDVEADQLIAPEDVYALDARMVHQVLYMHREEFSAIMPSDGPRILTFSFLATILYKILIFKCDAGTIYILQSDNLWSTDDTLLRNTITQRLPGALYRANDSDRDFLQDHQDFLLSLALRKTADEIRRSVKFVKQIVAACAALPRAQAPGLSDTLDRVPHGIVCTDGIYDVISNTVRKIKPSDRVTFTCGLASSDLSRKAPELLRRNMQLQRVFLHLNLWMPFGQPTYLQYLSAILKSKRKPIQRVATQLVQLICQDLIQEMQSEQE